MMSWTEADGNALFRHSPDERADDESAVFDGSGEAMRRLRFPFEGNAADAAEPGSRGPAENHND
jgi:hypothetical protein